MAEALLQMDQVSVAFRGDHRRYQTVVRQMSLSLSAGRTLCLVGESGCGKSVTASSILRLLPKGIAKITEGSIRYQGLELTSLRDAEMRNLRGCEIAMIFQDPLTSLNPVQRVGTQMLEMIGAHHKVPYPEAISKAQDMLRRVGIADATERLQAYPYQLSGGMIQRVMIAMALSVSPKLLIADEPTTALDVTIQAQVLDLMRKLRDETGMGILLITHDMGVVAEMADDVLVMYAGEMVESGPVRDVLKTPRHPYTKGLLAALPRLGHPVERLETIPGQVPPPGEMPGCRFAERCRLAQPVCFQEKPPVTRCNMQCVRCHMIKEGGGAHAA